MPCRSDEPDAMLADFELQLTAQLLVFLCEHLGEAPQPWMTEAANNIYCQDARGPTALCSRLFAMPKNDRNTLLFNNRAQQARALQKWWKRHCFQDAMRHLEGAPKSRHDR